MLTQTQLIAGVAVLGVGSAGATGVLFLRRRRQEHGVEAAEKILANELWVGATTAMVVEILGDPIEVSERVSKTKVKRVYKYHALERGKFGLKINLEDDVVVGWDKGE